MNEQKYNKKVIQIFKKIGALITDDHFIYTSGRHGSVYIRKDKLYPYTDLTSKICRMIAQETKDWDINVVVGPSLCGIVLSQWTAYHLSKLTKKEVLSVFTEKSHDSSKLFDRPQIFKRGYDALIKNKNVLVVEDLTTTGASVKKVVKEVKRAGGKVKAVSVLVNRNPKEITEDYMGVPFFSLATFEATAYESNACPLCKKEIPINTEVGHGKEYLEHLKNK